MKLIRGIIFSAITFALFYTLPSNVYASFCFPPSQILMAYGTIPLVTGLVGIALLPTLPITLGRSKELASMTIKRRLLLALLLSILVATIFFSAFSTANALSSFASIQFKNDIMYIYAAALVYYLAGEIICIKKIFPSNALAKTGKSVLATVIIAPPLVITGLGALFFFVRATYAQTSIRVPSSSIFYCPGISTSFWIGEAIKAIIGFSLIVGLTILNRKIVSIGK